PAAGRGGGARRRGLPLDGDPFRCFGGCERRGDLDVLDRELRVLSRPLDEGAAQPARELLAWEGGGGDLVDALLPGRLPGGRVRGGVRDLAVDVDALAAEDTDDVAQPPLRLRVVRDARVALRREDQEAGRRSLRAHADLVQERRADNRLVRDHEDVGRPALAGQIDDDVLHRHVGGYGAANAVDHFPPRPPGPLLRVRGDDGLGRRRLNRAERVADGVDRVGLDHEPVRRNPVFAQEIESLVQSPTGGSSARRLVHEVALTRLRDRADHGDAQRAFGGATVERLDQALASHRL